MEFQLFAYLFCLISASMASAMTWQPCDDVPRTLFATQVTLTPDPPIIGGSATFKVEAKSGVPTAMRIAFYTVYSTVHTNHGEPERWQAHAENPHWSAAHHVIVH